jgi:hypothetical protein
MPKESLGSIIFLNLSVCRKMDMVTANPEEIRSPWAITYSVELRIPKN